MITYTKEAKRALKLAEKAAGRTGGHYIGSEHLLAGLAEEPDGTAAVVLKAAKIEAEPLIRLIDSLVALDPAEKTAPRGALPYSPRAKKVLLDAEREAGRTGSKEAGTEHLLLAILGNTECMAARLLHTMGADLHHLEEEVLRAAGIPADPDGSGRDQAGTPTLDQYGRDLTKMAEEGRLDPVIGREAEIGRVIRILSRRTKNNPCLIGEPGVGKTAVAEGLAQRIVSGDVPESMQGRRIVVLDLSGMVAGAKYRGEFEERIKNVVREVANDRNTILFIDELHSLVGAGDAQGALDASNILKPSLSRGEIQVIGATTIEEYRKYIEKDAALERRFQQVAVEEPTGEEALEILKGLRPVYESHHGLTISDGALQAAVQLSQRYINDRNLPDKAIDLIDEAASKVRLGNGGRSAHLPEQELQQVKEEKEAAVLRGDLEAAGALQLRQDELTERLRKARGRADGRAHTGGRTVDRDTVAEIVSEWTGVPVSRLQAEESRQLASLEKTLHKRVIGQEEAVQAISGAIRRGRVGLKDPRRPTGSFLFLGPTGVGKTELSKAVAEAVFGSESSMIRVDMSEYMEKYSVSRLIGSPPGYIGYDDGGQLSERVRRHPYSVVLFDEIEKAHPDVFNILLQVLDEGHITDAHGRKVDFKNTCIIMTSNAGAQHIVDPKRLGFSAREDEQLDYERMKEGVMDEVKRIFRPEFLNRIDEIVVFHPLTKQEVEEIVRLQLKDLIRRSQQQMELTLAVRPAVRRYLAEKGYSPKFGARPARRAIQEEVENPLAQQLLSGELRRGDTVTVTMRKNRIVFQPRNRHEEE